MHFPFPSVASTLIIGPDGQFQAMAARQFAMQHVADGGSLVGMTDGDHETRGLSSVISDCAQAMKLPPSALERFHVFERTRDYRTSDELIAAIKQRKWFNDGMKPLLLRDMAGDMAALLPGASWLDIAIEAALLLDCPIVTSGHWGPAAQPAPDVLKYEADEVWQATARLNLGLTLERVKPPAAKLMLGGAAMPYGTILFEPQDTNVKEVAHAFAE